MNTCSRYIRLCLYFCVSLCPVDIILWAYCVTHFFSIQSPPGVTLAHCFSLLRTIDRIPTNSSTQLRASPHAFVPVTHARRGSRLLALVQRKPVTRFLDTNRVWVDAGFSTRIEFSRTDRRRILQSRCRFSNGSKRPLPAAAVLVAYSLGLPSVEQNLKPVPLENNAEKRYTICFLLVLSL